MNRNTASSPAKRFPRHCWILGGGRFGSLAVARIQESGHPVALTVIDERREVLSRLLGVRTVCANGIEWLATQQDRQMKAVDLIIPCIPGHVLAEWCIRSLAQTVELRSVETPQEAFGRLPNPIPGRPGRLYVSHADFLCPDRCAEPDMVCTHTGLPRPKDLFRLLAETDFPKTGIVVVRSHQLLPGVGGLRPVEMLAARSQIAQAHANQVMIATACRCHGVLDFLEYCR